MESSIQAAYDEKLHSPLRETVQAGGQPLKVSAPDTSTVVVQFPVPFAMPNRSGSYAKFRQLDLSNISEVVFSVSAPAQYGSVGGKVEVRIDAPEGALLGETEAIAPQTVANAPPIQARAALKPTTGMHDVYFVFRNEQAKQAMLFIVTTATFVNGANAATPSTPASTGGR